MKAKRRMDINCDMGEEHPIHGGNDDASLMPYINSCNICCGFHSSNTQLIDTTIRMAVQHSLKIGAHPSYNDRDNFGRVSLNQHLDITLSDIKYQVCALKSMTESYGARLNHIKAHGALYHDLHTNEALSNGFVQLIKSIDSNLKIFGMPDSTLARSCKKHGVQFINEVFADRRYLDAHTLVPRSQKDAVLHEADKIIKQLDLLLENKVMGLNGRLYEIKADTICIHSDTKNALSIAQIIYNHLHGPHVKDK